MQFVSRNSTCRRLPVCGRAGHSLVAGGEMPSCLIRCFSSSPSHIWSTSMPMIGGGGWLVGCIVMMMPGTNAAEFPCGRFRRKPPLEYPGDHQQRQPDKHQVKVNAVILDQGVQKVE